jgi:hypothetical protein
VVDCGVNQVNNGRKTRAMPVRILMNVTVSRCSIQSTRVAVTPRGRVTLGRG